MIGFVSRAYTIGIYQNWSPYRPQGLGWVLKSDLESDLIATGELGGVPTSGFIWEYLQSDGFCVAVPHWFLVAIFTTLAVLPWIRHLSRRFSLRTLLIATTLIAVVLGLVVYGVRQ
jgi:hypothetical protein